MVTDTVIDVALFVSGDDLVAMASCHDSMLRLFSHKVRTIIYLIVMIMITIATESDDNLSIIKIHSWCSQGRSVLLSTTIY